MARVVVGVDGSDRSLRALVRGQEEARLRDARLEAVFVMPPAQPGLTEGLGALPQGLEGGVGGRRATRDEETEAERERHAREQAHDQLLDRIKGAGLDDDGPRPRRVVIVHDEPAEALTEHAEGADMLVIGLRRRTPVGKLVLGSDARDIILQSRTPVLTTYDPSDGT